MIRIKLQTIDDNAKTNCENSNKSKVKITTFKHDVHLYPNNKQIMELCFYVLTSLDYIFLLFISQFLIHVQVKLNSVMRFPYEQQSKEFTTMLSDVLDLWQKVRYAKQLYCFSFSFLAKQLHL